MTSPELVLPATTARLQMLNKVPEVIAAFWIVKVLSTTVGETFADYLNADVGLGLWGTIAVMTGALALALVFQMRARRYVPPLYWLVVVLVSIVGTLITDALTDVYGVPLLASTLVFSAALAGTFALWYRSEGTLSIHTITTTRREAFYWLAILFTFSLGTAAGDYLSEEVGLGYTRTGLIIAGLIALTWVAYRRRWLGEVAAFWAAYVMTRPLGASLGDFLTAAPDEGGRGFSTTAVSWLFFAAIIALVGWMTVVQRRARVPA
ncbi:hypothetical protein [Demequina sp.]|uniref:COG4705 family protein n=1 Tax=Demequina sp. TaxID=2050685 RepID=UPI0025FB14D6|nr:hypothetical protein [Demequina sp.]